MRKSASETAIAMLARREHSRLELQRKLQQGQFSPSEIDQALEQLSESGQQSDQRYAESYTYSRYQKGYGPHAIQQQLKQQQIHDSMIATLLAEYDWLSLASTVRVKKFGHSLPNDQKERFKQMRFLQYRGFDHQQIATALKDE